MNFLGRYAEKFVPGYQVGFLKYFFHGQVLIFLLFQNKQFGFFVNKQDTHYKTS